MVSYWHWDIQKTKKKKQQQHKKQEYEEKKMQVVYHFGVYTPASVLVAEQQLESIYSSGLYDVCTQIHVVTDNKTWKPPSHMREKITIHVHSDVATSQTPSISRVSLETKKHEAKDSDTILYLCNPYTLLSTVTNEDEKKQENEDKSEEEVPSETNVPTSTSPATEIKKKQM